MILNGRHDLLYRFRHGSGIIYLNIVTAISVNNELRIA
jgi:hypothetical protein